MGENNDVHWLLITHTKTISGEWEKLVGEGKIRGVEGVEGANTFMLRRRGRTGELGRWLRNASGDVDFFIGFKANGEGLRELNWGGD